MIRWKSPLKAQIPDFGAMAKGYHPVYPLTSKAHFRQHNVVPDQSQVADLTHVSLAFMQSHVFNQPNPKSWPMFTTVEKARTDFAPGTAIMVSIGGWGDVEGFEVAARTRRGRELFARNVKKMVYETGADGKTPPQDTL